MAFGFSSKYDQDYFLGNLSEIQFLVLAIEAVKKQRWRVSYISETGLIAYTKLSLTTYGEEITIIIGGDHAVIISESNGNQLIDYGKNKRNVEIFVDTLEELKSTISAAEMNQKYEELQLSLNSKDVNLLNPPSRTTKEDITGFFSTFVPRQGYYITPVLINLNLGVVALMGVSPDSESLIKWGANFEPLTSEGEWWRLVTCCFVHIGILHLLMNMYALFYIGNLLEPYLDKTKFISAYLSTGVASSLTSLWYYDQTVSAGASGAIFGMYGVFLAMLSTDVIEKSARKPLLTSIGLFVVFSLMNGMKGGIDNAAHIGGLISGLLIGYCFIPSLKKPEAS